MKEAKRFKIEHIAIGIMALIIAALIVHSAMLARQNHSLEQELAAMQESIHEMLIVQASLEKEPQATEIAAPLHYRVIEHVLEIAPERLRDVFDEDVELNEPGDFVILPRNRILISGQWFCIRTGMTYTIEAIFSFRQHYGEIQMSLLSYSPFGWGGGWRNPWGSPNRNSWVRYHELESVPVRFYSMDANSFEAWYSVEYLNGETFSEELTYHTLSHLNRRIVDAWFVGRILYVNLHHSEPMAMSSGTTGEYIMYSTFVSSMASVPGIDALVILIDGQRETTIGGHGMSFNDIYLINDMGRH